MYTGDDRRWPLAHAKMTAFRTEERIGRRPGHAGGFLCTSWQPKMCKSIPKVHARLCSLMGHIDAISSLAASRHERPISLGRQSVRRPSMPPTSQFPSDLCKLPPFLFLRAQAIGKLATILVLLKTSLTAPAVPPFPSCAASAPTEAPKVQGAGASIGAPTFFLQVVERAGGISCTALSWILLPRAKWSR